MRFASLVCGTLLMAGLLSSATASDSVPLFGENTPEVVNPAASVNQLISRGKYAEALNLADKELAANPHNLNLRFLRGIIFTDTKRTDEAKKVFEQLIREFPEVSEPYNNLAVIYASEGNIGQAQALLESALNNHASSAITYKNLGDIYQNQAIHMYEEALRLNPNNSVLKKRLQLLREASE